MNASTSATLPPRPIDCETMVRRLWDFLDDELDAERLAEVQAHVAGCADCSEHVAFSRRFLSAVASAWEEAPDSTALRALVVARLAADGATIVR